ncbi:MAG TPA: CPBP family intramembrane glutamic endopeptidase [Methanoregulaceae archaeon]|nr:CPBP family intramembrane glutamic endopeptidase [Methanoregulaceae archaeon]
MPETIARIRNPYVFALILLGIFIIGGAIAGALQFAYKVSIIFQIAAADSVLAAIGILLLYRLGWFREAGYANIIKARHLPLLVLPLIVALLSFSEGITVTAPLSVVGFALFALLIGFCEETYFRGLMLTGLFPVGVYRAVLVSSFLFAAPHLLNISAGLWDPSFAAADTIAAFGIGVTFAALRIRTGSIWPSIGLHALTDFSALLAIGTIEVSAQSQASLAGTTAIGVILTVYGLFIVSEKHSQKILSMFRE